jgi:hypothetical protein
MMARVVEPQMAAEGRINRNGNRKLRPHMNAHDRRRASS